ncbi:MAG: hypothetical protein WA885_18295 [Phormidesmis sp.]
MLNSQPPRIPLFFAIGIGLSIVVAILKAVIAGLAESSLYAMPWIGGFLQSIELVEISNLVVFAILAAGIGAATVLVPHRWNHWAKIALLVVVSPFVFSASYMMQQHLWIQQIGSRQSIPYSEARAAANAYLRRETGNGGFFGFYPLTTQIVDLPTSQADLDFETLANPSDLLSQELAGYDDPRADLAAFIFARVGWLVRFMYMTIAALTALIYYFKGHNWAESKRWATDNDSVRHSPDSPDKRPAPKPKRKGS